MKTLKIILASLAIPALFATSAYAGSCGGCDKNKDEKKEASFVLNCGKKGDDDKKEAFVLNGSCGGCDKKDDKKEA